ncbi:MAG: copper transporter [Coriobacteriia bacterium]|nr:copper transporter [Coriobacteriia bacterium]
MYNLRYHIASLVAVFLALSVGLLLGTVVVERGVLTNQGTQIVNDLQQEFSDLRQDNADLREGLERDRLFATDAVPVIVSGALEGQTVLVLSSTGRADGLAATTSIIEQAGGIPMVLTAENASFGLDEIDAEALNAALFASSGEDSATWDSQDIDPINAVAQALAHELTAPEEDRPVIDLLVTSGQLGMESIDGTQTISGMALLASTGDSADPVGLALAVRLSELGFPVAGVEASSRVSGVVEAVNAAGLSAVDDVSSPQGAVSLAWVLAGRSTGYFGIRDGADSVFPVLSAVPEAF